MNTLAGKQVAEERRDKAKIVIAYDVEDIEGVKVRVWDSPGLIDDDDDDQGGTGNDEKCAVKMESEITELGARCRDSLPEDGRQALSSRRQGHIQNIDSKFWKKTMEERCDSSHFCQ